MQCLGACTKPTNMLPYSCFFHGFYTSQMGHSKHFTNLNELSRWALYADHAYKLISIFSLIYSTVYLFAVDLPQVNNPAHGSTYWTTIGITVGVVCLLILIALLVAISACCCICMKRKQTKEKSTEQ